MDPKINQKRCRVVRFYTWGVSAKIAPKTLKNAQDSSPKGLQMAILAPSWAILAPLGRKIPPTWPQLGSSWRLLGPSWLHLGPSRAAQKWPKRLPNATWSQDGPRSPPRPPPDPPDPPGSRFFLGLGVNFSCFLRGVPQRGSPKGAEGKGAAVLARRASSI